MPLASTETDYRTRLLHGLGELPPFSPTLNRVLATLADEDVSFAKLSEVIEKDTVLSGNVLKLVNSAMYGRRGEVNSVRHAVSLLGVNKVRNAALSMSISRMWTRVKTPPGWSMARFNLHSVAVAILSDSVSQRVPGVDYAEGAFVAGLLHDLGRLLIAVTLRDEYDVIMTLYKDNARPLWECEKGVLGIDHGEVSAMALSAWNLPEPIQRAVRSHHHPAEQASGEGVGLNQVLYAVDQYVNGSGNSIQPKSELTDTTSPEPFLRLTGARAEKILKDFETEFEAIRGFF